MNILIYNWRDIKNPAAGGAEVVTHEIAKRLVLKGHNITLFTAAFASCKENETVDGVEIIRSGGRFTVYLKAPQFYRKHAGEYDVVVDESKTLKTTLKTTPKTTPKIYPREAGRYLLLISTKEKTNQ